MHIHVLYTYSTCLCIYTRSHVSVDSLALNVHVLAEGLTRYLYNLSSLEGLGQGEGAAVPQVHSKYLSSWLDFLASHARSPQLLLDGHPVVSGLQEVGRAE